MSNCTDEILTGFMLVISAFGEDSKLRNFSFGSHVNTPKNKINGNVWELHTEGQNCDKQ